MTKTKTSRKLLRVIQHGILSIAQKKYPSYNSESIGVTGVYDALTDSYKRLGMNDNLADKMAKAIYHHAMKKLFDVNSLVGYAGSGYDYFRNKKGSDISNLMTNPELLKKHSDEIFADYGQYIISNMRKEGFSLEDMAKTYSLEMPGQMDAKDRKPYQGQPSLVSI